MASRRNIQNRVHSVQIGALKAFLNSRGYALREPWGRYLERYSRKRGGREDNVLVPTERKISDFDRRLAEAIDALARQLLLSTDELLREISNSGYEIVKIRVNEGEAESTIPYDTTVDLLKGGFALIDSAAVTAVSHERLSIVRGRRPDVVRRYLDDVRVGQTEVGSFVLTLLMPIGIDASGLDLAPTFVDEFGSRVSRSFSSALQTAEEAVQAKRIVANRTLVENGVTANFSGAIATILESAGSVSIGLTRVGRPKQAAELILSRFAAEDSARLREMETRLKPIGSAEPFTVTGTITEFREPKGRGGGSISVMCDVHGEVRQVRLKFERQDRHVVVHAIERKSDLFLEVDGSLVAKGAQMRLEEPLYFRTVPRGPLA